MLKLRLICSQTSGPPLAWFNEFELDGNDDWIEIVTHQDVDPSDVIIENLYRDEENNEYTVEYYDWDSNIGSVGGVTLDAAHKFDDNNDVNNTYDPRTVGDYIIYTIHQGSLTNDDGYDENSWFCLAYNNTGNLVPLELVAMGYSGPGCKEGNNASCSDNNQSPNFLSTNDYPQTVRGSKVTNSPCFNMTPYWAGSTRNQNGRAPWVNNPAQGVEIARKSPGIYESDWEKINIADSTPGQINSNQTFPSSMSMPLLEITNCTEYDMYLNSGSNASIYFTFDPSNCTNISVLSNSTDIAITNCTEYHDYYNSGSNASIYFTFDPSNCTEITNCTEFDDHLNLGINSNYYLNPNSTFNISSCDHCYEPTFGNNNTKLKEAVDHYLNSNQNPCYINISLWDVSQITDMSRLFQNHDTFNEPIGNWEVDNVIDMSYMFYYAQKFNQEIGNWEVDNVTDMSYMFYYAQKFNQEIGDWNVDNVTDMEGMFAYASDFNEDIGDWNYNTNDFNQEYGMSNWNDFVKCEMLLIKIYLDGTFRKYDIILI